jgi:VIT1/CCC1 family predicted Fe2+/Mn2+ transporter
MLASTSPSGSPEDSLKSRRGFPAQGNPAPKSRTGTKQASEGLGIGSEHHHRDVQGGVARAMVFGLSDGLVTNLAIVLGVVGAHPSSGVVRLVGLAGLLAGAFSMAAGEYVSMKAQAELWERELALEAQEIERRPDAETRELAMIYEQRGLDPEVANQLAAAMMRTPEMALSTHAREELGIDPANLGSPLRAAAASLVSTAVGSFVPLAPWVFGSGSAALGATIAGSGVFAVIVGAGLARFTGRSALFSAARQLLICAVSAAVTYGAGTLVGVSGATALS